MKPASFEYHSPESPSEAASILARHDEAVVVAGNQTLGMDMSYREIEPDHLVDIGDLDLSFVEFDDGRLSIGATTLHRTLARSDELSNRLQALSEAAGKVADPSVRAVGTLGGSLGKAHPGANYPTVLVGFETTLTIRTTDGTHDVHFVEYLENGLDEGFIESTTVPLEGFDGTDAGSAFIQLKRAKLTWPTVNAAAAVRTEDRSIVDARMGLANVAPTHVRVRGAEDAVVGTALDEEALSAAATAAVDAVDPTPELHADDEFKAEMAGEYTVRALEAAYDRATK
jgi:carbon-monoxide dehydrogenase medium subunit